MKYFICIFTDGRNKIFKTNNLKEAMDWYADNRNEEPDTKTDTEPFKKVL